MATVSQRPTPRSDRLGIATVTQYWRAVNSGCVRTNRIGVTTRSGVQERWRRFRTRSRFRPAAERSSWSMACSSLNAR
jgi:hypothetical protein